MSETLKDFNKRVTRLADWQLRIRARYEPMNGFAETAGVMHEMLAYIVSLEHQLKTTPQSQPLSDEEILSTYWNQTWGTDEDVIKFARAIKERILGK